MDWKRLFNEKRSAEIYNVRMPATWTDRILEFAALLLLIAMWVVAAVLWRQAVGEESIFNLSFAKEMQEDGLPLSLLFTTCIWTVVMLLMGYSAYRPRLVNTPVRITTVRQLKLLVTQMRVMNIVLGIMGICLLLSMFYDSAVWVFVPTALLLFFAVFFSVLIRRAGR